VNKWSEQFNIPFPECNMCGHCCKCASPSVSTAELIEKAKNGDGFARDFLSIFVPYENIEDAKKVSPSIVERSFQVCEAPASKISKDQLVFYRCKFLSEENKCLIYEDRPQLCRNYPDSPFLVFSKTCSYYSWAIECRKRYKDLKKELKELKELQKALKYQQEALRKVELVSRISNPEYKFCALVPDLCLVSPKGSWLKRF